MRLRHVTKAEFIAWLKDFVPSKRVGTRGSGNSCPIATYYKQTRGTKVCVDQSEITDWAEDSNDPVVSVPTRGWATEFINRVDNDVRGKTCSAHMALEYLGEPT